MVTFMVKPAPLPIDAMLPSLQEVLRLHRRAVLRAPPGAGKTTRVPPSLIGAPWLEGKKIIVLEPRRLAARAAAYRMAAERGEVPGETIGYRVRMETKVGPSTCIEIVTEGVLTRMLQTDPSLTDIGLIIFDEFHERSLQADLGLALCRQAAQLLRPDLRLLVMSATLETGRISQSLGDAPVLTSEGRTFDVETKWLNSQVSGPVDEAVADTVVEAISETYGSCLAFLPGRAEIARVERRLKNADLSPDIDVLPLYGDLSLAAQSRVIEPAKTGRRKIVLATAIAETSLTIEGVRIVVDSGRSRRLVHDPSSGMDRLVTDKVSRAEADQRRGRAGRTEPGMCHRLWPQAQEGALSQQARPEILTADLTSLALELAVWGAKSEDLDWIDRPPEAAYAVARRLLTDLGALDDRGTVTEHGRAIAAIPLHPRLSHMVVQAAAKGWGPTACCVAVLLTERDPMKGDIDMAPRLAQMASPKGPWIALSKLAKRTARAAGIGFNGTIDLRLAGLLIGLAYPDRIAQRRPGSDGRYILSGGRGAKLAAGDPLAAHEFLAVADLDGRSEARIYRAAPLTREQVDELYSDRYREIDIVDWDRRSARVVAQRQTQFSSLVLDKEPLADPPEDLVTKALLAAIRDRGLGMLPWTDAASRLRQRVVFLAHVSPGDWPDWSDAALMDTLEDWLAPYCGGLRHVDDFGKLDLSQILNTALGWERMRDLDRLAPDAIAIPSGREAKIDYRDPSKPVLAVKLQEMFGSKTSPHIADGRVPIVMHLLSPAGRPFAVTGDLARFWSTGYNEVRKDGRGRYPKHPWPDDPISAAATAATKRRAPRP